MGVRANLLYLLCMEGYLNNVQMAAKVWQLLWGDRICYWYDVSFYFLFLWKLLTVSHNLHKREVLGQSNAKFQQNTVHTKT